MQKQTAESMRERRQELLGRLAEIPEWMTGSLVETTRVQAGSKKPFRYLSRSVRSRNRVTYVAVVEVERFRECLKAGRRVKQLAAEIAELTVAIVKAESKARRSK